MSHFTPEQLKELENRYGLVPMETLPVRDGVVNITCNVWWRSDTGPEMVAAKDHWRNIKEFPSAYQHKEPKVEITYKD